MPYNVRDLNPAAMLRSLGNWRLGSNVLVVACLVLPLGLFCADAAGTYRATLREAEETSRSITTIFERYIHNEFETYGVVLRRLDEQTSGKPWTEIQQSQSLHEYLTRLLQDYPRIGALTMIDSTGLVRASTLPIPSPPPNFADRSYFMALRDNDTGTYIDEGMRSPFASGDRLNIVRRRTTLDGKFDGILLVSVEPLTVLTGIRDSGQQEAVTWLLRADGGYLAWHPSADRDLTKFRINRISLQRALAGEQIHESLISGIDDQNLMMTYQKIGEFPVVLVRGISLATMLRPWHEELRHNIILFGTVTICLTSLAVSARSKGRPEVPVLDELASRTQSLADAVARRQKSDTDLENALSFVGHQEAERIRISRELHDNLGQYVALLHLNVDAIASAPDNADHVRKKIAQQKETATKISLELSRVAWELRPVWLNDMGLEAAISSFLGHMKERSGLELRFDCNLGDRRFSAMIEGALYRAVQEAVTNIMKHANATHVDILLDEFKGNIRLMIEDNGKGFATTAVDSTGLFASPNGGLGLRGIRERLALVQGSLVIESEPGNGAVLTLIVPV